MCTGRLGAGVSTGGTEMGVMCVRAQTCVESVQMLCERKKQRLCVHGAAWGGMHGSWRLGGGKLGDTPRPQQPRVPCPCGGERSRRAGHAAVWEKQEAGRVFISNTQMPP